jgi:sugar/nucleoside kinase (ribokinase family)
LDLVKVIDLYPPESSIADITAESMVGGGCSFNGTLNRAKFDTGLELYALGAIGNDSGGDLLVDQLRRYAHVHLAVCAEAMNLSDLTAIGGIRPWEEVFEMEKKFPYQRFRP